MHQTTGIVTLTYDTAGRRVVGHAAGCVTSFPFDAACRAARVVAPLGGIATMVYDANHCVPERVEFPGRASAFEYDGRKWSAGAAFADGARCTYVYADDGGSVRIDWIGESTSGSDGTAGPRSEARVADPRAPYHLVHMLIHSVDSKLREALVNEIVERAQPLVAAVSWQLPAATVARFGARTDFVQEATIEVLLKLRADRLSYSDRGPKEFQNWLETICRNACADVVRGHLSPARRPPIFLAEVPEQATNRRERSSAERLRRAIAKLEDPRHLHLMRHLADGDTIEQAADALGVSSRTINRDRLRAQQETARLLDDDAVPDC